MSDRVSQLEEQLAQAECALERTERLAVASRFASVIMHEVNNPLEAITNLVYLTKLQNKDPDQVYENMLVIEDQLKTLGKVTSQALTFHREQQTAKAIDLVEIAESALKLHSNKFIRHRVAVKRRFRGPAIATVFGSEILQVVSNLILNAVDAFGGEEGTVCIGVKTRPHCVHITVSDNGPGIPESFAARLFSPYVTSKSDGTGLGLWLSRRIIAKHGGTLRFRTSRTAGKTGTTFRINLPNAA